MFFNPSESGCTILKASLVKVCQKNKKELYQAVCINGHTFKGPNQGKYDFNLKKSFEAEGHLRELLKLELRNLEVQIEEDCSFELWLVSSGSPCYTHCSGACESGLKNIPSLVEDIKTELKLQSLTVRIAFAKQYKTDKEGDDQFKLAITAMIEKYKFKIYMCDFDADWWERFETPVCNSEECKKELQENWAKTFNETYSKLTEDWDLKVGRKPFCIYPNKNKEKENSRFFFINEEWQEFRNDTGSSD